MTSSLDFSHSYLGFHDFFTFMLIEIELIEMSLVEEAKIRFKNNFNATTTP